MVIVYIIAALTLLFNDSIAPNLKSTNRIILASVILLYAAFKFYRFNINRKKISIQSNEEK